MKEDVEISDGQKLRIIQASRKLRKIWNSLNREQKIKIFEGMDIGTDTKWVTSLFEEARERQ